MTSDQIGGLIRTILVAFGGIVLGKGWVDAGTWTWIVSGAATIGPAIWSWYTNRPAGIASSAQNLTGVTVTTTPQAGPSVIMAVNAAKAAQ